MKSRSMFHALVLVALMLLPSASSVKKDGKEEKMNVLFLISDDLRTETGSYGGRAITPNLDRLAAQGVQFDRAYCQYPLCNPSRTSMLFGRHLGTTKLFSNRAWIGDRQPDWSSLPMWFRKHGYTTMRAGKVFHGGIDDTMAWSEGGEKRRHGGDPKPEPDGSTPQPRPKRSGTPGMSKREYSDRWAVLESENGEGYGDFMVADLAIDYLQRVNDRTEPWFIFCGFSKPHTPFEAPQRFYDLYELDDIELTPDFAPVPTVPEGFPAGSIRPSNADLFMGREASLEEAKEMTLAYYASVSWMDYNAGRVLDELDRLGMRENTIVVFWGDHGFQLGEKGKWSKAGSLWEQGCRVPTIIFDPRVEGNGETCTRITQSIDFYPTLVDLCGLPLPEGLDGLSLKPLLEDPLLPWDHPAFTVWSENGSTGSGMPVEGATMTGVSLRTERWHYAEFFGRGPGSMLLDPESDPFEMSNLAMDPAYSELCRELSGLVHEYAGGLCAHDTVVSDLEATVRQGQVFLTWSEKQVPSGTTFNVFMAPDPITSENLSEARLVGHHIEAGSACDWWRDPASFDPDAEPDRTHGFMIHGRELDPESGLFVHTVQEKEAVYFAVLPSTAGATAIVPGENSLKEAVRADPMLPRPIILKEGPAKGSARGESLTLVLHGRGGGWDKDNRANFLVFGDGSQGWREGLARKFVVESNPDGIVIYPLDRIWIGRPLLFSWDKRDHVPAINTWWYGCNEGIYDARKVEEGVVVNYTEQHLLYLVRWAREYFGTDPDRTYIRGKSMGGSGAISTAFHHPDVFATVFSQVPIVSYTSRSGKDGVSNLKRLDGLCGRVCDETVMSSEGIPVMERMNSERILKEYKGELPFLVLCNGRSDASIPWINNPSFYRALDREKRGYACYWNNGAHGMSSSVPEDINDFYDLRPEMPLGSSYPAFSNFSDNCDPGKGEKEDGDTVGWLNRGLYWTDPVENENSWSIRISAKGSFLPGKVEVDVTPRRLTRFRIAPEETLLVNGKRMQADENGLLTIPKIQLKAGETELIEIHKK